MKFYKALGEVIREERHARGLTLRDVSTTGYVSLGHLSDVERGHKEGSSSFLDGVSKAMGIETYELILKAGYRMADFQIPDTPQKLLQHSFQPFDSVSTRP